MRTNGIEARPEGRGEAAYSPTGSAGGTREREREREREAGDVAIRVVHEIYRSPPNTGSDRVSELSIMSRIGGGGWRERGGGISDKSFVHIRHVHIGGFGPPVEKYFITRGGCGG